MNDRTEAVIPALILILMLVLCVLGIWELRDIANLDQRVRVLEKK